MTTRRLAATALLGGALLIPAAPAAAAKPPKGDYYCSFYNGSYNQGAGVLHIVGKSKYRINEGKKGRFTRKGNKLKFKSGDYEGTWKGRYKALDGGRHIIYLLFLEDGEDGPVCERS